MLYILWEHSERKEGWVAVGNSCNLKYSGKVVSEEETTLMVRVLERRDGTYEIKKKVARSGKKHDVPVKSQDRTWPL